LLSTPSPSRALPIPLQSAPRRWPPPAAGEAGTSAPTRSGASRRPWTSSITSPSPSPSPAALAPSPPPPLPLLQGFALPLLAPLFPCVSGFYCGFDLIWLGSFGRVAGGPRVARRFRVVRESRLPQQLAATAAISPPPPCRPWNRADLMRRLASFKAMTWFAKPKVHPSHLCHPQPFLLLAGLMAYRWGLVADLRSL
jgi:hypothetical protein